MKQKFIIYTFSFNIVSGGVIVLHQLCDLLNQQGHDAKLWIYKKPIFDKKRPFLSLAKIFKYKTRKRFKTHHSFNTPIAKASDLENAIVIYPEIIDGNPLNAKHVVRWLLHKPGFHSGRINYGNDELIFGYGKECSGSGIIIDDSNLLVLRYIMSDVYKQKNFEKRSGSCYMVRKGIDKPFVHDEDAICVDTYTHEELSEIFNKVERFISYDPYTYYTTYASLCGCDSIVIPDDTVSKEQWHPKEADRYGIAYGLDDITYSKESKNLMIYYIKAQEKESFDAAQKFASKCIEHFIKN
jgi:hypothetical protein